MIEIVLLFVIGAMLIALVSDEPFEVFALIIGWTCLVAAILLSFVQLIKVIQ